MRRAKTEQRKARAKEQGQADRVFRRIRHEEDHDDWATILKRFMETPPTWAEQEVRLDPTRLEGK